MITKIISGGQVGADIAALRAAKRMGLKTGGTAPQGYKTLAGPNHDLRDRYHLEQSDSDNYSLRTHDNVRDSDGTLRIARNFETYGEQCTLKAINRLNKPYFDIWLRQTNRTQDHYYFTYEQMVEFMKWLNNNEIKVLNVAGNSAPAIESVVEEFLCQVITLERGE